MFYQGRSAISQFGYATSTDAVNWRKYDANPILGPGDSGTWDEQSIISPTLLFDENEFHMWYSGWDKDNNIAIGYNPNSHPHQVASPAESLSIGHHPRSPWLDQSLNLHLPLKLH